MRTWLMKRNCSFSPKQVGLFYLSIVSFSLLVAGYFLLIGVWMIIIFTTIEILALTIALYVYSRHALDYEKITIVGKQLLVERSWGGRIEVNEFNTVWTKLIHKKDGGRDLVLVSAAKELPIGYFVLANQQEQFEKDLGSYLGL
ncbi:MAG: DUF2244 domain-containing protein [Polynucleobacter sp.]|uniref:DUF2244 domain-containing protein n=1 Tax=Polynucleobacter sp. TaxID=2029855 RepID=UPI00216CA79F|nr:DUF2244 domain-containing protein [Polynucleobacter sp.]MBU3670219.1 DUF2244 domain-containing protein [Polynucleobacter sp.]